MRIYEILEREKSARGRGNDGKGVLHWRNYSHFENSAPGGEMPHGKGLSFSNLSIRFSRSETSSVFTSMLVITQIL